MADTTDIINGQIDKWTHQLDSGALNLGMLKNPASAALNATGNSTESSRAYGGFRAGLEKMRNDSLRLNKGVQTEGDAQRAWNELLANISDGAFVKERLATIRGLNDQARLLHRSNIDLVYQNFGRTTPEWERPTTQAAPAPHQPAGVAEGTVAHNPTTGEKIVMKNGQWMRSR